MRCVAIITGPQTYLDHLGVLSHLIEIPLIVTEEKTYKFAKKYYPDIDVSLKDFSELSLDYLAHHFDVIFETGKFWAAELGPFFELMFRKKMRFVFCPHGNSDKGHSLKNHVEQDISLTYGEHLSDLQKQNGAANKIKHFVRTGNYRYPYYLKHRAFYDSLAHQEVFSHFAKEKPTILYAPTWQDQENPTSFFSAIDTLIEKLCESFNIVIKLHPFLSDDFPAQTLQILGRYQNHPSAFFLTDFPPIYPLLSRCDLYLGDYSSIGYDFLAFDKPLFFLNPKQNAHNSPLKTCGLEIPIHKGEDLKEFLIKSLDSSAKDFSKQRQSIYSYSFGEERSPLLIRSDIFNKIFN
jgi:hypothetical protein